MEKKDQIRYEIVEETVTVEEREIVAYGISVVQNGTETARYSDISPDREKISRLASLLNKMDAASVHLEDIVEDFLP